MVQIFRCLLQGNPVQCWITILGLQLSHHHPNDILILKVLFPWYKTNGSPTVKGLFACGHSYKICVFWYSSLVPCVVKTCSSVLKHVVSLRVNLMWHCIFTKTFMQLPINFTAVTFSPTKSESLHVFSIWTPLATVEACLQLIY